MGTWSAAILGNDTSAEVAEYFASMYSYQEGGSFKWSTEEITASILTFYFETLQSLPSEKCNVLFSLANSLWQKGELTNELKQVVKKLIVEKTDYNAIKELDASDKFLVQRWKVTNEFLKKIKEKNAAAKTRVLQQKKVSLYKAGDCLAYLYKGFYYGILIGNDGRNIDDGSNDLLFLDLKTKQLPVLKDFAKSKILLNEDVVNYLLGIQTLPPPNSNVAFAFNFKKTAVKSLHKSAIYIGRLPLTRTFFQSSTIRFTDYIAKSSSAAETVNKVLSFWEAKKWKPSVYEPGFECTVTLNKKWLQKDNFVFNGITIGKKNIYAFVDNSLWHVNVFFRVKGMTEAAIEKNWIYFAAIFEHFTGREINNIAVAAKNTKSLQSFNTIDFKTFKLKHVKDINAV